QTSESNNTVIALQESREQASEDGKLAPELIVVDGRLTERPIGRQQQIVMARPGTHIPCSDEEREQWYVYKLLSDKGYTGTRFTHKDLGTAIGVAQGTARHYFSDWLVGVDINEILVRYEVA